MAKKDRLPEAALLLIFDMLMDGCPHKEIQRTTGHAITTIQRYFPGTAWTHHQVSAHGAAVYHAEHNRRRVQHLAAPAFNPAELGERQQAKMRILRETNPKLYAEVTGAAG